MRHLTWHRITFKIFKPVWVQGQGQWGWSLAVSELVVLGPFTGTTSAFLFCHSPSGSSFTLRIVFIIFFSLPISTLLLSFLHCPPPLNFSEQDQNRFHCSFLIQSDSILPSWLWQILAALHRQEVFNLLQNW